MPPRRPEYHYGRASGRYRSSAGRFVPEVRVRLWLDDALDAATKRIDALEAAGAHSFRVSVSRNRLSPDGEVTEKVSLSAEINNEKALSPYWVNYTAAALSILLSGGDPRIDEGES